MIPSHHEIFIGIMTFNVSLGITKYSINKKQGKVNFMTCVLGKRKEQTTQGYIDLKYDGIRVMLSVTDGLL